MRTALCDQLGIEYPIFAFTHCRDVVVAVSKAGGFGVLGAVGFSPEQLEIELNWIDEHIGDHPYGVDIVIPNKYEGMDAVDLAPEVLKKQLNALVPAGAPGVRQEDPGRPRCADGAQRRRRVATAGLDRGHRHPAGRGRAEAPEDDTDRQRAGHPPGRDDQAHPRRRAARSRRCAVRRRRPASTPTPASTSSSPRAARPVGTAVRSARSCCGRRWSRRSHRCRCWRPAASAAASRSPRRWRSGAQGAWTGSQWVMVEESRAHRAAARGLRQGRQQGHRAQPLVHRQAGPDAAQRLDRGLGEPGEPEAARNAVAVHGFRHGRGGHAQVPQRDASTSRSTRSARWSVSSPRSRRPRR